MNQPDSAPTTKPPRRWRRRLKITFIVLLILVAVGRLAMGFLLPTVIRQIANAYDLDCTYGRIKLSVTGGTADVWNLVLKPKSGGESIVVADYIHGNISPLNLLRLRLIVWRAEVDGVNVVIEREADGGIPLLKKFLADVSSPKPAQTPDTTPAKPIDLQAPLFVEAVRLSHVVAKVRDLSVTPHFEATLKTSLRLTDVGATDKPLQFEADVNFPPLLDSLYATGTATSTPSTIDLDAGVAVRGLRLRAAEGYLIPLGLKPVGEEWTADAKMKLSAAHVPNSPDFTVQLALSDLNAAVDLKTVASLAKLTADVKQLGAKGIDVSKVSVEGGSVGFERTDAGALRAAGLELIPVAPAPTTKPAAAPVATKSGKPFTTSGTPFAASVQELSLNNLQATFTDHAIAPATSVVARVETLSAKGIRTDSTTPVPIVGTFGLPGIVRTIGVEGTVDLLSPTRRAKVHVSGAGMKPDAIAPYLAAIGIESQLDAATFNAELDAGVSVAPGGTINADFKASNIRFDDGATPLLAFASADVVGASFDPQANAVGVKSIDLLGPTLSLRRDADGHLYTLGLRTRPRVAQPTSQPVASATTQPAGPIILPRIEIGRFTWNDVHFSIVDETQTPAATIALGDAGVEVSDLLIDLRPDAPARRPGRIRAWLALPKIIDAIGVDGTLVPEPGKFVAEMSVTGHGLSGLAIAPYVKPFGIEPTIKAGDVKFTTRASLTQKPDGIGASLLVSNFLLNDGPDELVAVDSLNVAGLELKPGEIGLDELTMVRPHARITRHADGSFQAAGIHVLPSPAAPAPQKGAPVAPLTLSELPIKAFLKKLQVTEGAVHWIDRTVTPTADVRASASVLLSDVRVGAGDVPATLKVDARVDGTVDAASVDGQLWLSPTAPGAKLHVKASGLRAGSLKPYLPAGVDVTLQNGAFETSLEARLANHPAGGLSGRVDVSKLSYADGAAKHASVGAFTLDVARFDPSAEVYAVRELSSKGVAAEAKLNDAGEIEALGIRFTTPPPAQTPVVKPKLADDDDAPEAKAIDVAQLVAAARKALPKISVETIDLNTADVRLTGFTGPGAAPVVLSNARVKTLSPISLGGPDAEWNPPVRLQITGGLQPVVSNFDVAIDATPLANDPVLSVDVSATGIRGAGLTELLPTLRPLIDGESLSAGSFKTHLDAGISYGRRGPRDLDILRGFNTSFTVRPVEFRATPDGPVIAGLEEIRAEQIKVEPKKGNVTIKNIDVTKPVGRFYRDNDGVHAFGLVLPIGVAPSTQPTTEPSADVVAEAPKTPDVAPAQPTSRPASEIKLERLAVSGIDVIVEDRTSKPVTIIPLKTLDLEVRDISNQMPWTGKPMRFTMLCTSDKVPLPPRKGATGTAVTQPTEGGEYLEERDLFSQVTASGKVGVKQVNGQFVLDGWSKMSVSGFELLGVRGLAEQYGVTIGGGAFDYSNDIRFKPEGLIETKNRVVFTNLSLNEAADGPLQRAFKLPAPIDVAIGAVTDPDGSITLNLPVPVRNGTIRPADVVGPAVGAVGGVLITAIASAPIKAIGGIGDLLGGGNKSVRPADAPVTLAFLPGYAELDDASLSLVGTLVEKMKKDPNLQLQLRHELTTADVDRTGVRANPDASDISVLAARVRQERERLVARRAVLVAQARGDIGSRSDVAAGKSVDELKAVDRQIAQADNSMDQLYDLLKPGSAAQADRRTRAASLDVARERLDRVKSAIVGVVGTEDRVHLTNPQYDPEPSTDGGRVVITLVRKKK